MTRALALLVLVALSGCAPGRPSCLFESEQPMIVAELFFGRDISGREPLTDREWSDFVASVIAGEFPKGFTVTDGDGEWRDPTTGTVIRERTKIFVVAAPRSPDLAVRISRVRDAYIRLYPQTSVGVVTYDACGAF